MMGSVIFKNQMITAFKNDDADNAWLLLGQTTQHQIREGLFSLFNSKDEPKIKDACMCVAVIARFEIPRGLWDEFLSLMARIATAPEHDYHYRLASMQTLGMLSEFMEDEPLTQVQIGHMLHSTIGNIDGAHLEIC